MNELRLAKKIGVSGLIFVIPFLIVALNLQLKGSVETGVDAVYIYHIGDTDKAILPVVIASQKPAKTDLKSVFGEYEWQETNFYKVESSDLKKLISALKSFFAEQKKDAPGHAFGTFKITFSEKGKKESRIFAPVKFLKIVNSFSKLISGRYGGLSDQFSSYRSRIRVR